MTEARDGAQTWDVQAIARLLAAALQAVGAVLPSTDAPAGKCTQSWCPLCAMAAVAAGETHPLAAAISEHGAALITALLTMTGTDDEPSQPPSDGRSESPGRYQSIPVTVHD